LGKLSNREPAIVRAKYEYEHGHKEEDKQHHYEPEDLRWAAIPGMLLRPRVETTHAETLQAPAIAAVAFVAANAMQANVRDNRRQRWAKPADGRPVD